VRKEVVSFVRVDTSKGLNQNMNYICDNLNVWDKYPSGDKMTGLYSWSRRKFLHPPGKTNYIRYIRPEMG
jgi:hypothetical protein